MLQTLVHLIKAGRVTPTERFPDLPDHARGLPTLTSAACSGCGACEQVCPTRAITVREKAVTLDLGRCIACDECVEGCETHTIAADRSTRTAVRKRTDLIMRSGQPRAVAEPQAPGMFSRSLHVREVSTGDNATDLEVAASVNPIFDGGRFGVHFVASPRHADALLVTGPVGLAMHEPLRRCYEAMAEPRLVIAAGADAISGGLYRDGYAQANGVEPILPVDVWIPGAPPHPWSILHGLVEAMGRDA